MFINALGAYVPSERVHNDHFLSVNGLTSDWILQRTGIVTRSKAGFDENTHTMGINACKDALQRLSYPVEEVDLIVGASYSPYDTVATLAHVVQREFGMINAKAVYISSACSSFVNALEIVEGYFATGKAKKALIVCSEHNTYYSNEQDPKAGHLWGDAAVAMFLSKEKQKEHEPQVLDIYTRGLGHIGKGPGGVYLHPKTDGIQMPDGRDVFIHACKYMCEAIDVMTARQNMKIQDLNYIICHQANKRIVSNIMKQFGMTPDRFLNNIEQYGNTGSASAALVLSEYFDQIKKGEYVALTVFGGGYSSGGFLVRF